MKSERDLKLECLKLASLMAASKQIVPSAVIPKAMEFFQWIDGDDQPASEVDRQRLARLGR